MSDPGPRPIRSAIQLPSHTRRESEPGQQAAPVDELQRLQNRVGNRGMQQLLSSMPALLGPGTPLPATLLAEHEQRFGTDLGRVRVHDHEGAHQLAHGQLARAFTLGSDIVFNRGFYQPGTLAGQRLIAHELAHVVQQGAEGGGASGPAHELAADAAAQAAVSGVPGPLHAGPAAAPGIQCEPLSPAETASANAPAGTSADAQVAKVMQSIQAELTELTPQVNKLGASVLLYPADHALNAVKYLADRVRQDEKAVREFEVVAGNRAAEVHAYTLRFQALQLTMDSALAVAQAWHDAHPCGESLGMMNESAGVWLAGAGESQWDKGGWHYVPGALAYIGSFGVAVVDSAEKLSSLGYHDAATAVSQAYTRGDISWNEGEEIMSSAAKRAIAIALVTRGTAALTSRLGVAGAEATGLASTTLRYGFVAGAVPGGLSAVTSLGTQALLTKGLEGQFSSPAAKAIWSQGMPQGKDWAISIPLGIVMGGLGGMRGVELANDKLVGTVINTPEGPMQIAAITKLKITANQGKLGLSQPGVMVLKPVGSRVGALPPPPVSELTMVFDPLSNSWVYPESARTGLISVTEGQPATPATGGATAKPTAVAATKPTLPLAAKPTLALPAPKITPTQAAQPTAVQPYAPRVIPAAPQLPASAKTTYAGQRQIQAEDALASANQAANQARQEAAKAQADVDAANELLKESGGSKDAKSLLKGAEADLLRAQNKLKPLERSEAAALQERDAVVRGGQELAKIEKEIAGLDAQIKNELDPPGGFTREQLWAGRRPYQIPPTGTPDGQRYHDLELKRGRALERLGAETKGLTSSLSEQVDAATPGAAARPSALANAAQLDPVLRPVNGTPIDVTTGLPMKRTDWATDHIMSRSEIASDPRFARLTPLQRDAILLEVPENYLPMTPEANSSKLNLTVDEWIAARAAKNKPLPSEMATALRAADQRARSAVEAAFNRFLSP
ncbi:DUF4157 domain-containing protein [Burkholderiaceae bacterium UC74_6]